MHLLEKRGAKVSYSDPHVPSVKFDGHRFGAEDFASSVDRADCVVIVTDHDYYDVAWIVSKARCIVDTRNMTRGYEDTKIFRI